MAQGNKSNTTALTTLGGSAAQDIIGQLEAKQPLLMVIRGALERLPGNDFSAYRDIAAALNARRERLAKIDKRLVEQDKAEPAIVLLAERMAEVFANDEAKEDQQKCDPLNIIKSELTSEKPSLSFMREAVFTLAAKVGHHSAYEKISAVVRSYRDNPDAEKGIKIIDPLLQHLHKPEEWAAEHKRENAEREWGKS